jgi:hypothetical protein
LHYRSWIAAVAPQILERLGFWTAPAANGQIALALLGPADERVDLAALGTRFRAWLDAFSNDAIGLLDDAVMRRFESGFDGVSIGARAEALGARPPAAGNDQDPAFAAAIELTPLPIHDALGVRHSAQRRDLPYAWSEETHAARIRAYYENTTGLALPQFSGQAVSVLRDPPRTLSMLVKLRDGVIVQRAGKLVEGTREIGPAFEGRDALVLFARALRAAAPCADGRAPSQSPDDFLAALEKLEAFQSLKAAAEWEEWRGVIRGLVLDAQAHQRPAGGSDHG